MAVAGAVAVAHSITNLAWQLEMFRPSSISHRAGNLAFGVLIRGIERQVQIFKNEKHDHD
ncbi:MAG: hypothetical protein NVSMB6_22730 [Burkholderiaceae bacterium]